MPRETTPVWLRKWVSLQIRRGSIPNKLWWVNWIQLCFFELWNKPCKKHYKPRQNNLENTEKVIPPFILQLFYYCSGHLVGRELLRDTVFYARYFSVERKSSMHWKTFPSIPCLYLRYQYQSDLVMDKKNVCRHCCLYSGGYQQLRDIDATLSKYYMFSDMKWFNGLADALLV